MLKFTCDCCSKEFEVEKPVRKEYIDYLLGPCSKNIAYCPECGNESREKLMPKPQKAAPPARYCDGNCHGCGEQ